MARLATYLIPLLVLLAATAAALADSEAQNQKPLLLILDASGSMWGQIEGENKIVIARRVLGELVDGLDAASEVGVIAYGHRSKGDCDDIETVVSMGSLDREAVKGTVNSLNPTGKTPITKSVNKAFDSLEGLDGGATIVLISDGLETCGGDPCAAVRAAKERGIDFRLHVVGFDVAGEDVSQLECAAQAGDGLFFSAENAEELAGAMDTVVALAPEVPPGRLSVKSIADGELQDASVVITNEAGADAGGGRTYASAETNPRSIPLPDGRFDVVVKAVGIKGDIQRRFQIEIEDGSLVEKQVDFSTGEISIGTTMNGELTDAVYHVTVPSTGQEVAAGRTYESDRSNPAKVRLTSGTYDVSVKSVKIKNSEPVSLGPVTIEPAGSASVSHAWATGTLRIGASRGSELIDATLSIRSKEDGKAVGQGRTYTNAKSNPKTFILLPGTYSVTVGEIRGPKRTIEVVVEEGKTTERSIDPAGTN